VKVIALKQIGALIGFTGDIGVKNHFLELIHYNPSTFCPRRSWGADPLVFFEVIEQLMQRLPDDSKDEVVLALQGLYACQARILSGEEQITPDKSPGFFVVRRLPVEPYRGYRKQARSASFSSVREANPVRPSSFKIKEIKKRIVVFGFEKEQFERSVESLMSPYISVTDHVSLPFDFSALTFQEASETLADISAKALYQLFISQKKRWCPNFLVSIERLWTWTMEKTLIDGILKGFTTSGEILLHVNRDRKSIDEIRAATKARRKIKKRSESPLSFNYCYHEAEYITESSRKNHFRFDTS